MKSSQHTESLQQALMHPARDQFWYLKPATLCLSAGLKSLLHSSWEMAGSLSYYKCLCKGFLTWCQLYSLAALLKCSLWAGVRRGIHSSELHWHGEQSWAAGLGKPASCCQLLDLHKVTLNILLYKTAWCFCSYLCYSRCCICYLRAELNAVFLGRHHCCSLALCPGWKREGKREALDEGLHPVHANTPQNKDSSWDAVSPIPSVTAFSRSPPLWQRLRAGSVLCCGGAWVAGKQRGKPASGAGAGGAGGFSPQLVTDTSLQTGSLPYPENKQSLQLLK